MTTTTPPLHRPARAEDLAAASSRPRCGPQDAKTKLSSPWASGIAVVIAIAVDGADRRPAGQLGRGPAPARTPVPAPAAGGRSSPAGSTSASPTTRTPGPATATPSPLSSFLLNTIVITLPAVFIPITLALLAAYAFAWIDFKGKNILFVAVFAMQIVPIQVALIPLNTIYVKFGLNTSFWSIWLSHTIFGLPLAIFLLHNFMKEIPASLVEAARVDGAGHVKIFLQVLLPLLVPAIASFGIFQFLWVWNDLLVALTFSSDNTAPITKGIQGLTTQFAVRGRRAPGGSDHRHAGAAGSVPVAAALLRPRPARRQRQGLIGMAGSGLAPLIGIVEVAALAGVSPATVSRALRGLPGVSAATRANVEQAAADSGYFISRSKPGRPTAPSSDTVPDDHLAPLIGIAEVAALAGVSAATVSRALRGVAGVSGPTRAKVERAAATLGYVASPSAATLPTGRTNTIGVVAPWNSRWFVGAVVEGAQEVVADEGYHVLLSPLSVAASSAASTVIDTRALHKRVDGVLALNLPRGVAASSLYGLRVPLITVGNSIAGISGVVVDDTSIGLVATSHLLRLGHRKIAFVGRNGRGAAIATFADDRAVGYAEALAGYGLDIVPWLVRTAGLSIEAGTVAMHRMWNEAAGDQSRLPTAVSAVTDEVAMGVLHFARNQGIRIPEQLSVIGADNHDLAYLFDLDTVGQHAHDQGRIAARMLLERLRPGSVTTSTRYARLDPYVIERRTVAPPLAMGTATADEALSTAATRSQHQRRR